MRISCAKACALLVVSVCVHGIAAAQEFDLVIQGGRIIDGSGASWYNADLGIRDGRIARIGRIAAEAGETTLDAQGLVVAPGMVDMMGQSASSLLDRPETAMNLLTQGITTINCGEGISAAPLLPAEDATHGWTTMREYLALLDMQGLPLNVVQSVGHTQVRRIVLGDIDRRPSPEELQRMQELVREAMQAGACGVSTALIYPPAVYAPMEEIASLAEVAGEFGGSYYTHMRNEGDHLLEAIEEALEIGRRGKTPVHIFHLKAAGRPNWGKMQLAIAAIKAARSQGQQVTADIYPYVHNGLNLTAFIHPRHFADGHAKLMERLDDAELRSEIRQEMEQTSGWENWYRHTGHDWNKVMIGQTSAPKYADHAGRALGEIAQVVGEDPWDTFFNLVAADTFALPESMTEANKILAMQQDFISFCTDVGPAGQESSASHPRGYGAFPRLLSRYVRDLGAITLERAVAQGSAAACSCLHVFDRGRIAEGLAADLILFDFERLRDRADFAHPSAVSEGIECVIVNGHIVLRDGELTSNRPGRVLRGPGFDAALSSDRVQEHAKTPTLSSFDEMARRFLKEHRVPGLAIAVTDHGRLVHASGYGFADLARGTAVAPDSLFRIASISKPITAVAILQLCEQGKLALTDRVLDHLDLHAAIELAEEKFDPRWQQITIEHLLQHRGGWDRDQSFDAMFQSVKFARAANKSPPADQHDVITAMLAYPLDFEPGSRYAYSNFGYNLLGRVIEACTGEAYETYVRKHVLEPLGIRGMRLGRTRLPFREAGEVRYYHPQTSSCVFEEDLDAVVPSAYGGWNLEAMDAHGGWLASAVDLARFAAAFDDPEHCKILSAASIARMHLRPSSPSGEETDEASGETATYYSLGWQNRVLPDGQVNHWHTGSLPGTATILIRRHDGKCFVALLNSRVSPATVHLGRAIDSELHTAANAVSQWPEHDLFELFLPRLEGE